VSSYLYNKKNGAALRVAMALQAMATGPFRVPYAVTAPMGLGYKLAGTINATYDGGIDVPLEDFSGANINTISETSKRFPKFNIKTKRCRPKIPHLLCIEFLQELCLSTTFDGF
jgi:hypothetical protein